MATETVINRPAPFVEDIGQHGRDERQGVEEHRFIVAGPGEEIGLRRI